MLNWNFLITVYIGRCIPSYQIHQEVLEYRASLVAQSRIHLQCRRPRFDPGNPLQYTCLENSMDRGAWWATIHGVAELDTLEQLTFYFLEYKLHICEITHIGNEHSLFVCMLLFLTLLTIFEYYVKHPFTLECNFLMIVKSYKMAGLGNPGTNTVWGSFLRLYKSSFSLFPWCLYAISTCLGFTRYKVKINDLGYSSSKCSSQTRVWLWPWLSIWLERNMSLHFSGMQLFPIKGSGQVRCSPEFLPVSTIYSSLRTFACVLFILLLHNKLPQNMVT